MRSDCNSHGRRARNFRGDSDNRTFGSSTNHRDNRDDGGNHRGDRSSHRDDGGSHHGEDGSSLRGSGRGYSDRHDGGGNSRRGNGDGSSRRSNNHGSNKAVFVHSIQEDFCIEAGKGDKELRSHIA